MSRLLRIDIENGVYHVTRRGWERRVIVRDDRAREYGLNLLDREAVRCGWEVLAWMLLDNHFHIFLRTPKANSLGRYARSELWLRHHVQPSLCQRCANRVN